MFLRNVEELLPEYTVPPHVPQRLMVTCVRTRSAGVFSANTCNAQSQHPPVNDR
jgi:hypothetical protein